MKIKWNAVGLWNLQYACIPEVPDHCTFHIVIGNEHVIYVNDIHRCYQPRNLPYTPANERCSLLTYFLFRLPYNDKNNRCLV